MPEGLAGNRRDGRSVSPGALRPALAIGLIALALLPCGALAQSRPRFETTMLPQPSSDVFALPMIAARGDRVAVATPRPVLWASRDGGRSFAAPQSPNALSGPCTDPLAGPADVAVAADGALFAVQHCFALGGAVLIWRSADGGASWAPPSGGRLQVIAAGMAASVVTADPVDPRRIYVVGEAADLTTLIVWKSTDGGRSFAPRPINVPRSLRQVADDGPSIPTRLLVDPTDRRRLYVLWWAIAKRELAQLQGLEGLHDYEFATKAFAAVSTDAGSSWSVRKIIDTGGPPPSLPPPSHEQYDDLANWLPAGAVDGAGTVYFAVAEQRPHAPGAHIMLMSSRDHGATWSERTQVDQGQNATFAPALVAGSPGRVGIAFLQADRPAALDKQAQWSTRYAFGAEADSARPRFIESSASGPVLTGAVCPLAGGPHSCRARTLSAAADSSGRALIAGIVGAGSTARVQLSRQVAGPTLLAERAARAKLRLSVRPRRTRVGRRTAFRFTVRVTRGGRTRRVARARIQFAGRRARTNRRGRARIIVRFRAPGRRRARATKRGFRAGSATVRVGR